MSTSLHVALPREHDHPVILDYNAIYDNNIASFRHMFTYWVRRLHEYGASVAPGGCGLGLWTAGRM